MGPVAVLQAATGLILFRHEDCGKDSKSGGLRRSFRVVRGVRGDGTGVRRGGQSGIRDGKAAATMNRILYWLALLVFNPNERKGYYK